MKVEKYARVEAGVLLWAMLLLVLCGCSTPQTQYVLQATPANLPLRMELSSVPFYSQSTHQCGPAALATVLNAGGVMVSPKELTDQVYLPGRAGSLQVEMLAATRRHGLLAYPLVPHMQNIFAEVAGGTPVVVLQNLGLDWWPVWHYAVVIGYDLSQQEVILRSGLEPRLVMPLSTFERTWARAGYWAMLAVPAGTLPVTANEATYIAAAVALEKNIAAEQSEKIYRAALNKWPVNLTAHIGLGNALYQQKETAQAEAMYRQATLSHPDSAIAFNNLAQVLFDQQRYVAARDAALRAVSLGGSEESVARETLEMIEREMR